MKKVLLAVSSLAIFSCASRNDCPVPGADGAGVVARVNGVPIYQSDLKLAMGRVQHDSSLRADTVTQVLDTVIRDEAVRQESVKLGLDRSPEVQAKMQEIYAQYMAAQRAELGNAYFRNEIQRKATPTDEQVKQYFDTHQAQLQKSFHLQQLMVKGDPSSLEGARRALESGTPFEQVAAARFPPIPVGVAKPWDMGALRWSQMQAEWRDVVTQLKPGGISGVVAGVGKRFWILHLVGVTEAAAVTFETEKPIIVEILKAEQVESVRTQRVDELRQKAHVERVP